MFYETDYETFKDKLIRNIVLQQRRGFNSNYEERFILMLLRLIMKF